MKRARSGAGRLRLRTDAGASLVLALVFITSLGCMGLATLDLANESFREDRATQAFHSAVYGGGGALDAAANAKRSDLAWGREGAPCSGLSMAADDGATVIVQCTPVHGSGALIVGGAGARSDRVVDLAAVIGGTRVARARVEFVDGGGNSSGAVVRVRNWTTTP